VGLRHHRLGQAHDAETDSAAIAAMNFLIHIEPV